MYSRQDRKNRFSTKKERDAFLTSEIAKIQTTVTAQSKEVRMAARGCDRFVATFPAG